jgi:hypothetical protein
MTYVPSVSDFRARYPEFAEVTTHRLQAVLGEVALEVGETWLPELQKPAALALAAHLLAETGALNTSDGMVSSVAPGTVIEQHAGDTGQRFATTVTTASGSSAGNTVASLSKTPYGLRFLELRDRAFPPIMVV